MILMLSCLAAVPLTFPAYVTAEKASRFNIMAPQRLSCVPTQKTAAIGTWFVLQSVKGTKAVSAKAINPGSVMLAGKHASTENGTPVEVYVATTSELMIRFPAPFAAVKSRKVQATGSYTVAGSKRLACFTSVMIPTCVNYFV